MIWYTLLAIFPVLIVPIINTYYKSSINNDDKAKRTFLFWCGISMFLMLALRSKEVGSTDPMNYYDNWHDMVSVPIHNIKSIAEHSEMEIGYLYAVGILSKIFPHPQSLFVITGAFYSFSVCRFVYKNSDDPTTSLVMFTTLSLYTFMTQAIRQAIAMCICLYAIEYCKNRKLFKFVLLVLLAMTFHNSAVIFFPVYLFYLIPLNSVTCIISFFVSGVLLFLSPRIISIANQWYGSEYYRVVDSGGFVALIVYIIIVVLAILLQKQAKNKKQYEFFFFLTFAGASIYAMRYIGGLIAGRISNYYMFGQIILLPNIIASMDKKTGTVVKCHAIVLCVLLFIYRLIGSDLIPFKFFWQ